MVANTHFHKYKSQRSHISREFYEQQQKRRKKFALFYTYRDCSLKIFRLFFLIQELTAKRLCSARNAALTPYNSLCRACAQLSYHSKPRALLSQNRSFSTVAVYCCRTCLSCILLRLLRIWFGGVLVLYVFFIFLSLFCLWNTSCLSWWVGRACPWCAFYFRLFCLFVSYYTQHRLSHLRGPGRVRIHLASGSGHFVSSPLWSSLRYSYYFFGVFAFFLFFSFFFFSLLSFIYFLCRYLGFWRASVEPAVLSSVYDGMGLHCLFTPFTALRCTRYLVCCLLYTSPSPRD